MYVTVGSRAFFGQILDRTPPKNEELVRDFKHHKALPATPGAKPDVPSSAGRSSASDWRPAIAVAPGHLDLIVRLSGDRPGWTAVLVHRISNLGVLAAYGDLVDGNEVVALEGVNQETIDAAVKLFQESGVALRIRRSSSESPTSLLPAPMPASA